MWNWFINGGNAGILYRCTSFITKARDIYQTKIILCGGITWLTPYHRNTEYHMVVLLCLPYPTAQLAYTYQTVELWCQGFTIIHLWIIVYFICFLQKWYKSLLIGFVYEIATHSKNAPVNLKNYQKYEGEKKCDGRCFLKINCQYIQNLTWLSKTVLIFEISIKKTTLEKVNAIPDIYSLFLCAQQIILLEKNNLGWPVILDAENLPKCRSYH